MIRQLANVLQEAAAADQAMQHRPPPPPREKDMKLKVPEFDCSRDVEMFITQFQEVAELQELGGRVTVLKAQEGLKGKA